MTQDIAKGIGGDSFENFFIIEPCTPDVYVEGMRMIKIFDAKTTKIKSV